MSRYESALAAVIADSYRAAERLLQLIRGGVQIEFCACGDAHKMLEPRHEPKVRGVRRALREVRLQRGGGA